MTIICGGNRQEILEDDERTNHFATAKTDTGQTVVKIASWPRFWARVKNKGVDSSFDKEEEETRAGWMVSHP